MSDLWEGTQLEMSEDAGLGEHQNTNGELPFPLHLELIVTDRDVIRALVSYPEGEEREQYALEALKVGVVALRHVGGFVGADFFQRETNRMVDALRDTLKVHAQTTHEKIAGSLHEYFDPKQGRLNERLERLLCENGELERFVKGWMDGDDSKLARTMIAHVGNESPLMKILDPQQSAGLLAMLRQLVERELNRQRDDVLKEFSLDEEKSAMSRFKALLEETQGTIDKNLTLDDEKSALARLKREMFTILEAHVKTNAEFQEEVKGALRELVGRREEQARTTLHGTTFQQAVFESLYRSAAERGDIADFTGDTPGAIKNRKFGDVVIELGPDTGAPGAKIVFEAKEEQGYTLTSAREEIENARKNRLAQVGVFVFSSKIAPQGLKPITPLGCDVFVKWDPEDATTDSFLLAGFEIARARCINVRRQKDEYQADFAGIETAILDIEKRACNLEDVKKHAETIHSCSEKILDRLRIDRGALQQQVSILREKIDEIRNASSPGT